MDIQDIQEVHSLRRLKKRIIRTESHIGFLRICVERDLVSKGFQLKWRPAFETDEEEGCIFDSILHKTSLSLIENVMKCNISKLHKLRKNEKLLLETIPEDAIPKVNIIFRNELNKLQKDVELRKCRKINSIVKASKASKAADQITDVENNIWMEELGILRLSNIKDRYVEIPVVDEKDEAEFYRRTVIGDGNCLFRALSVLMFSTEVHHDVIRDKVVQNMYNHEEAYASLIDIDFKTHMAGMKKTSGNREIWATEAEIQAAADCLKVDIKVNQLVNGSQEWQTFPSDNSRKTIHIYHRGDHYEPMMKVCTSQKMQHQESKRLVNSQKLKQKRHLEEKTQNPSGEFNCEINKEGNVVQNKNSTGQYPSLPKQRVHDPHVTLHNEVIIFNHSKRVLSEDEEKILSKGLKFVPTRRNVDTSKLLADLREWERKMRLREYFFDKNKMKAEDVVGKQDDSIIDKIRKDEEARRRNKNWMPQTGRDPALDMYICLVKEDILKGISKCQTSNISTGEQNALRTLMNDNTIIIRPADKGSGIVVMDTAEYVSKVEKDLQQDDTYIEMQDDSTKAVTKQVGKIVKQLFNQGIIDEKVKNYMMPLNTQPGVVKANPKVHKQDMPMRTIVSTKQHPTTQIAEVAEHELGEYVSKLPSYVKDTTDFLRKIEEIKHTIPSKVILFTLDVRALYPSIPRKEALVACREALNTRGNQQIPTDAVLTLIETVLDNSTFSFNHKNYKQIDGTAIGSKLGRNYACTYMGKWEKQLLSMTDKNPLLYLRYVDDIFGIWDGTDEELNAFLNTANTIHPRIKLEMTQSSESISFLDVLIKKTQNGLETTIYTKETDKHMYLHKSSDHPNSTKRAIPYGLGIRARRICSTETDYNAQKRNIANHLKKRGYKYRSVNEVLQKVDNLTRNELLEYRNQDDKNESRVPLVVTCNRRLPHIQEIVHDRMSVLHRSEKMMKVFPEAPLTAYRRDTNMEDMLVHSKYNKIFRRETYIEGTHKCDKNCAVCMHMKVGMQHISLNRRTFCFKDSITCKTENVVYGIFCSGCDAIIYVGETGNTIYERFQNHFTSIRKLYDQPVAIHFSQYDHTMNDLRIIGIEKIKPSGVAGFHLRKIRESFWIKKLSTIKPVGINQNYGVGDTVRIK